MNKIKIIYLLIYKVLLVGSFTIQNEKSVYLYRVVLRHVGTNDHAMAFEVTNSKIIREIEI